MNYTGGKRNTIIGTARRTQYGKQTAEREERGKRAEMEMKRAVARARAAAGVSLQGEWTHGPARTKPPSTSSNATSSKRYAISSSKTGVSAFKSEDPTSRNDLDERKRLLLQSDNWDIIKPHAPSQHTSSSSAQAPSNRRQNQAVSIKHDIRKYDCLQTYSYAQSNLFLPSSSYARTQAADSSTSLPDSPMILDKDDEDITAYSSSDDEDTDTTNAGNSSTALHNLSTQAQMDEDEILSDDSDIDLSFLDAKSIRASSSSKPSSASSLRTQHTSKPSSNANTTPCNPDLQFLPSPYKYYKHISELQVSPVKLAYRHPCLASDANVPFCYSKETGVA